MKTQSHDSRNNVRAGRPFTLVDEGDERKYRTELPNFIDDLGLSVYAYRLYGYVKRRAGAKGGVCNEGLRGIARECGMSLATASKARKELLELGLIRVHVETVRSGAEGKPGKYDLISISDIWSLNKAYYAAVKCEVVPKGDASLRREYLASYLASSGKIPVELQPASEGVLPREHPSQGVSPCEQGCSTTRTGGGRVVERKKEPLEERTSEEKTTAHTRVERSSARARRGLTASGGCGCVVFFYHSIKTL
jgi:hypothetical protein